MEFLSNKYVLLSLTIGVFVAAKWLQRRVGSVILNPILITILVVIGYLLIFDIDYSTYAAAGDYIDFWLKPAIVALGVPLYKQLENIRRQILPLFMAELAGCIIGIISVVLVAQAMGAEREVIMSLAPKATTTPIAMEVSRALGGVPALSAAVVICTGIFGGMIGYRFMDYSRVKSNVARGLSLGTAAHAIGTSTAIGISQRHGAFASLGLILNGILTALIAPYVLAIMGY